MTLVLEDRKLVIKKQTNVKSFNYTSHINLYLLCLLVAFVSFLSLYVPNRALKYDYIYIVVRFRVGKFLNYLCY